MCQNKKRYKKIFTWRFFHRYVGLVLAVLMLVFCVSGIILNHRTFFADCNVSRCLLPSGYQLKDYNNGIVRGTLKMNDDKILFYGCAGIWLAHSDFSEQQDFNLGLPDGMDNRNIRNVVRTKDGVLWCAAPFNVYRNDGELWKPWQLEDNKERISDITLGSDSSEVVVVTRSRLYCIATNSTKSTKAHELKAPESGPFKVTLFKVLWMLHSGELFGLAGRIVVDVVALIIIIICLTGIVLFILPFRIRHTNKVSDKVSSKRLVGMMKKNIRWHNKIGASTLILTLIIAITGMCLRPPLMIPFVMVKMSPILGTSLYSKNVWHDKLRAIRWDNEMNEWLLSTSEGFYSLNRDFSEVPKRIIGSPLVSPMGVTIFEKDKDANWIIGSFSGLYCWDRKSNRISDYFTGNTVMENRGRPVGNRIVSGYSNDTPLPVVFEYDKGAVGLPSMSKELASQPLSLWNAALELHVGRCFNPLLGPFSELYVFVSGLLLTLVLVSGYIIYCRSKKTN